METSHTYREDGMTDTIDCRTCENYRYHPNSGPYCYNEEHWRKHCIDGDQHKSMPAIQLWRTSMTTTPATGMEA